MSEPLLTRRAVVLAKIESTYNVDASPVAASDAILVEDPDYKIDVSMLDRNNARFDLDSLPSTTGRKLASMTFTHEIRSNGRTNSGLIADAPCLGRLLRACGYAETAIASGTGQVGAINAKETNTNNPSWAAGGSWAALSMPVVFEIEVTTGGASGTAKVKITPDAKAIAASVAAQQTNVVVTTTQAIDLKAGGSVSTITPTFSGNLVVGDKWYVIVYPVGIQYLPVSSGFESLTIYMYLDGLLHKMPGARGTFTVSGEAGGYAKAQFTFTGQYVAPVDAALPTTAKFERQTPAMVELSDLYIGSFGAVCSKFDFDLGVTISPRVDANSADGYNGVRVTARDAKGSIDPEATLVADFAWWTALASGTQYLWRTKVGQTAGNRVFALAPCVQITGLSYADRDQIRTMDVPLKFSRWFGNDSLIFHIS